jgi:phosphoglycerate-specific signal transduction histidine kinase
MAASIVHEVNQPLAGIVTNANTSLRWLAGDSPNLAEARDAIGRIIRDGSRAGIITRRIRALFTENRTAKERLDINEAIEEVAVLTGNEMRKNRVVLQMELGTDLPPISGDRVQLQQVIMNLILNGIVCNRVPGRILPSFHRTTPPAISLRSFNVYRSRFSSIPKASKPFATRLFPAYRRSLASPSPNH